MNEIRYVMRMDWLYGGFKARKIEGQRCSKVVKTHREAEIEWRTRLSIKEWDALPRTKAEAFKAYRDELHQEILHLESKLVITRKRIALLDRST